MMNYQRMGGFLWENIVTMTVVSQKNAAAIRKAVIKIVVETTII